MWFVIRVQSRERIDSRYNQMTCQCCLQKTARNVLIASSSIICFIRSTKFFYDLSSATFCVPWKFWQLIKLSSLKTSLNWTVVTISVNWSAISKWCRQIIRQPFDVIWSDVYRDDCSERLRPCVKSPSCVMAHSLRDAKWRVRTAAWMRHYGVVHVV